MDIHAQDTTFGSDSRSVLAGTVVGGTQNGMQGVAGLSTRDALLGDPKQVKVGECAAWSRRASVLLGQGGRVCCWVKVGECVVGSRWASVLPGKGGRVCCWIKVGN